MARLHAWPVRALGMALACGLLSAAVYQGAIAAFAASTKTPASSIVSLDPVTLTSTVPDDTTTFDVPNASGTYPVVKCMPITFTPVTATPVLVRPYVAAANKPAGALDPQLNVKIEFGASSASAYNCGAFVPDWAAAYSGTWSQFLSSYTGFNTALDAGTITNENRTYAARVTFTLINPGNPPAPGVMSRVVLSFGARPCGPDKSFACLTKPLYYLANTALATDNLVATAPSLSLPLRATPPDPITHNVSPVPDYATGQGSTTGLPVQKQWNGLGWWPNLAAGTNIDHHRQIWQSPQLATDLTLSNSTQVTFWAGMKAFSTKDQGQAAIALYDCVPASKPQANRLSLDCGPSPTYPGDIVTNSQVLLPAAGLTLWGSNWVKVTSAVPSNFIYTFSAGHIVVLALGVNNASGVDMQFAYDTVAYPSVIER